MYLTVRPHLWFCTSLGTVHISPWSQKTAPMYFPLLLCIDHWGRLSYLSLLFFGTPFKWVYLSFSPLPLASLLFSAICKASSDNHFVFLHLFFLGMFLIPASCKMLGTSVSSSSGTLSDLIPWIYLSLPLYNHMGFDLGLESPLGCKEILSVHPKGRLVLSVHWKDWRWCWNCSTLAIWCEKLTHLKRPWWWERLRAGEGDDRGWDGWMASPTQWTWVWVNSGSWWWTGRPGMLWSMGSQRVGHDWATELNWTDWISFPSFRYRGKESCLLQLNEFSFKDRSPTRWEKRNVRDFWVRTHPKMVPHNMLQCCVFLFFLCVNLC